MLNVISLPGNRGSRGYANSSCQSSHKTCAFANQLMVLVFRTRAFILLTIFTLVNLEGGPFCLKFYCENSMRKCAFPQSMLSTQHLCGSVSHVMMTVLTINTGWGNSHHDLAGSLNSYQNPSSPPHQFFLYFYYYFFPLWALFTSSFTCEFGYYLPLVPSLGFSVEFVGGHRLCHS